MNIIPGKLLSQIHTPEDLRKLSPEELVPLSQELRQFIVDIVSIYGGHFGASLGVVELTVALHYVFKSTISLSYVCVVMHVAIQPKLRCHHLKPHP